MSGSATHKRPFTLSRAVDLATLIAFIAVACILTVSSGADMALVAHM